MQTRRDAQFSARRRGIQRQRRGHDAIGLALSGGGIRSATFSLGVVQVLAEKGFLKEVDFLSTVSGGGYTGCFLTQRLGNGEPHSAVAAPHGPDPEPVRYVRQHAKFLSPSQSQGEMVDGDRDARGMLLNWTAPLLVILLLALCATPGSGPTSGSRGRRLLAVWADSCCRAMVVYGLGHAAGEEDRAY